MSAPSREEVVLALRELVNACNERWMGIGPPSVQPVLESAERLLLADEAPRASKATATVEALKAADAEDVAVLAARRLLADKTIAFLRRRAQDDDSVVWELESKDAAALVQRLDDLEAACQRKDALLADIIEAEEVYEGGESPLTRDIEDRMSAEVGKR